MAKGAKKYEGEKIGTVVRLVFNGGTTVEVDTATLPDGIKSKGLVHGVYQKLIDSGAGKELPDFIRNAQTIARNLIRGKWNDTGIDEGLLAEAIAKVTGKDLTKVEEQVFKASDDQMKKWAAMPAVGAAMQQIEARRMAEQANKTKDADKEALNKDFA